MVIEKLVAFSGLLSVALRASTFYFAFWYFRFFRYYLIFFGIAFVFWRSDQSYVAVLLVTVALYVWFTFNGTEWRIKIRA